MAPQPTPLPSRRQVLRWGALVGVAGGVAGCTSGPTPTPPGPSPSGVGTGAAQPLAFPRDFLWGAATSAYQVEGAADVDGRGPSVWDTFAARPGTIQDGSTGAVAADQYHRYADDIAIMRELGLRSYRFSVSWSRVLPSGEGKVNQKGLDYYRRLVDALRAADIAPVLTLWHWDTPEALEQRGGWASRATAYRFADYAGVVVDAVGDRLHTLLTLNEPKTVVQLGYVSGVHAPGRRDPVAAVSALHHLHLGHGLAVAAARASRSGLRVGPCFNLAPVYTADDSDEAAGAAIVADTRENTLFLDPVLRGRYPAEAELALGRGALESVVRDGDLRAIAAPVDLVAVNYYNPVYVQGDGSQVHRHPVATPAEWLEIYPQGLFDILLRVHRDYGGPELMITENGRPDAPGTAGSPPADDARISYVRDHLAAAERAVRAGVRLSGYQLWSLLDNFEWATGYSQRFGIVHVDFDSQKRTPKKSALWYRDVIRSGRLQG
ncbi:MAG: GH1 family beta-glucosidase [Kineosporiaceae bacterium]